MFIKSENFAWLGGFRGYFRRLGEGSTVCVYMSFLLSVECGKVLVFLQSMDSVMPSNSRMLCAKKDKTKVGRLSTTQKREGGRHSISSFLESGTEGVKEATSEWSNPTELTVLFKEYCGSSIQQSDFMKKPIKY